MIFNIFLPDPLKRKGREDLQPGSPGAVAREVKRDSNGLPTLLLGYSDLNINHPAGQRALETRIRTAAEQVCGRPDGLISLKEAIDVRSCVRSVTQTAMTSIYDVRQAQFAAR